MKLQLLGFIPSIGDTSLFFFKSETVTMYVLVYVDDIIVVSSSPQATSVLLHDLEKDFALKDLGELHFLLVLRLQRSMTGLCYHKANMSKNFSRKQTCILCKLVQTTFSTSEKLSSYVGDPFGPVDATNYRSIVGGLQYLTLTQPDLAFSVNKVCQYLQDPTMVHLTAVKRILQFVKGGIGLGLQITKSSSMLVSGF
jgi:hypothetical protein